MKKKYLFFILFSLFTLFISTGQNLQKPLRQKLSESLYQPVTTEKNTQTKKDEIIAAGEMFPSFEKNTKLIDMPLAGGIHTFATIVNQVGDIVVKLCILCCFLCIIFNCFKLWFSTTEVKKFFVDIIYKLLICIILLLCYVPFTNSLLVLATELGASISGGYEKINRTYVTAYANMETAIEEGLQDITKSMYENAVVDKDGNKYISNKMVEDLIECGMSENDVKTWAEKNGLNIAYPTYRNGWKIVNGDMVWDYSHTQKSSSDEFVGYSDKNGNALSTKGWFFTSLDAFTKKIKKTGKKYDAKKQKELVKKINSLQLVLSGEDIMPDDLNKSVDEQTNEKKLSSVTTLKNMYYAPYLVNTKGDNTFFLSPSKILKTVTVMSDAVAYSVNLTINEQTGDVEDSKLNPGGIWTFKGFVKFLEGLIYKLGMMICCVIIMAEYTLTILEFFLIRGLATLLIPFFFLDVTKSYAENLIKIFFSYFFKILITVFICYFSMGLFLDTAVITFATPLESFTIVLYLSTLTIGTMFCAKVPQILNTLLSGNPSMGWGSIVETARGAAQGLHMAQHAAQSAKKVGSGLAHVTQGVVRGGMGASATLDSMASAYNSATGKMKDYNNDRVPDPETGLMPAGFTGGQMKRAGVFAALSAAGDSMRQSVGDTLYKGLTGQEKRRDKGNGDTGTLGYGQSFIDIQGHNQKANFTDMKDAAVAKGQSIGSSRGDSIVENKKQKDKEVIEEERKRQKSMPPNDQDSIL